MYSSSLGINAQNAIVIDDENDGSSAPQQPPPPPPAFIPPPTAPPGIIVPTPYIPESVRQVHQMLYHHQPMHPTDTATAASILRERLLKGAAGPNIINSADPAAQAVYYGTRYLAPASPASSSGSSMVGASPHFMLPTQAAPMQAVIPAPTAAASTSSGVATVEAPSMMGAASVANNKAIIQRQLQKELQNLLTPPNQHSSGGSSLPGRKKKHSVEETDERTEVIDIDDYEQKELAVKALEKELERRVDSEDLFFVGEEVLAYHSLWLYKAKIKNRKINEKGTDFQYLLHYLGWNSKYVFFVIEIHEY